MSYKMYLGIELGKEGFMLPVLPEKIEISEGGDNKTYDVINLGEINTINLPKLTEINFESFFPKHRDPYVSSEQLFEPNFYISKIREWREKKQRIRFIFINSSIEINDLFSIENFKFYEQGGEVGDINYSIELKRYKQCIAKKVVIQKTSENKTVSVQANPSRPVEKPEVKTYTVVKGDTLWAISKRFLGNGNRYPEVAKLNNIKNPNRIYPGQTLKLP